jgi:hypothetical protein
MRVRCSLVVSLAMLLCAATLLAQQSKDDFASVYETLRTYPSDPCDGAGDERSGKLDDRLLRAADERVRAALNASLVEAGAAERAAAALKELGKAGGPSSGPTWEAEAQFHYSLQWLTPVVVVKMGVRSHEVFAAYALTQETWPSKHTEWHAVASSLDDDPVPWTQVEMREIARGPADHARFLAVIHYGGCAGSSGVRYRGYEWDPNGGIDSAETMLDIDGASGMDPQGGPVTKKNPFPTIGTLNTKGSRITLPYCIWSDIDWWDNPSLCVVDTFDVSGDAARFVSRRYNRPELVPIAKAIEYAKRNELPELRAFCTSDEVAQKLLAPGGFGPGASDPEVPCLLRTADGCIWRKAERFWWCSAVSGG